MSSTLHRPSDLDQSVAAAVKAAEARGDPPLVRAVEASHRVWDAGLGKPSLELCRILVSSLCFENNTAPFWKLLDQVLALRLLSPIQTLALLTPRVVPNRRVQPEAYRLYLDLLSRYVFTSPSVDLDSCRDEITKSVDEALQLSNTYAIHKMDFGQAVVLFVLSVLTSLIDATLEDLSLQSISTDRRGIAYASEARQVTNTDLRRNSNDNRHEHREQLRRTNFLIAIEAMEKFTANEKTRVLLRLISLNMPENFRGLLQKLHLLEANKSKLQSLIAANHVLAKLLSNIQTSVDGDYQLGKCQLLGVLVDAGSCGWTLCQSYGAGRAACWIPFDIFMENAMDGKFLHAISPIEILTELTKTLQVINKASWQETFQALWVSALRLIQRDRDPWEGPVPHLDTRLCMLLSIVPLAIVPVLKEDNKLASVMNNDLSGGARAGPEHDMEGNKFAPRSHGLISSLQVLGQFSGLLSPPSSVVNAANNAATKAVAFMCRFKTGSGGLNVIGPNDASVKAVGNMLHLIVEACISRNLIDTSAYFWPGYVAPFAPSKSSRLVQESPWSTFMAGAQLSGSLRDILLATPASSIAEVEKLYQIALSGSEEDRLAAAKILCGASLVRGWNIQEHVVHVVVKLLSPPTPPHCAGNGAGNNLISYMPMISAILFEISCIDIVHILSLYGMVPDFAAALMPLCEIYGSQSPPSNYRSNISDQTSIYAVFSCAFLCLLRLWKFYKLPEDHTVAGRGGTVKPELTLDYLLLMRNSRIALRNSAAMDSTHTITESINHSSSQPVYIHSFPKLRAWYFQNQACIASTLSGPSNKNPVHQVANKILSMICRKMAQVGTVSGNLSSNSGSSISGSPISSADDAYQRPKLPAWEILEAIPFVLEAILTACAHGRLSSRDLTTGLRDLVDFLPASLATIVSYFSAEITRGIWRPVSMNGTDWPSPAANLQSIESEIKEVLASAGVHVPSCWTGDMTPMLPLPMAALVSLTITFKLDRNLEYVHGVVGQALENCATGCSWPSMPIIGALWTQKVPRWHDFIVLSCARAPFTLDKEAIVQLIRSCFSSFLGRSINSGSHLMAKSGVNGLLGEVLSDNGLRLPVAPGFLYLRTCRAFHEPQFLNGLILKQVIEWAHELTNGWSCGGPTQQLRSGRTSLAEATARVREVATLGSSLLCIAGGIQLVQVLYQETVPTALLSERETERGSTGLASNILEGYAMAYMLILSGSFVWGIGNSSPAYTSVFSSRRARVMGKHMDFVAGVVDGNVLLGCDPATWKAYVSCLVGLLVSYVPAWLTEVKQETLRKLASGLRGWHECELALLLLERGGPEAMEAIVESVL